MKKKLSILTFFSRDLKKVKNNFKANIKILTKFQLNNINLYWYIIIENPDNYKSIKSLIKSLNKNHKIKIIFITDNLFFPLRVYKYINKIGKQKSFIYILDDDDILTSEFLKIENIIKSKNHIYMFDFKENFNKNFSIKSIIKLKKNKLGYRRKNISYYINNDKNEFDFSQMIFYADYLKTYFNKDFFKRVNIVKKNKKILKKTFNEEDEKFLKFLINKKLIIKKYNNVIYIKRYADDNFSSFAFDNTKT